MVEERRNDMARRYVSAFALSGSNAYIRNLATTVTSHQWGDALLPMTISDGEPQDTFVCSPWVGYVDYTKEELARFPNPAIVPALKTVIGCVAKVLKFAEIDKIVHVNNWMMSTNLLPDLDSNLVSTETSELSLRFPNHFLATCSLRSNQRPIEAKQRLLPRHFKIMVANFGQQSRRFARSVTRAAKGVRHQAAVLCQATW